VDTNLIHKQIRSHIMVY